MQAFAVEHILPRSRGGKTVLGNLALSCQGCNNHKYAKTNGPDPKTGKRVPLYHPRKQRWSDHFAWNENHILIVGLTPTGRATVEALQLNREGLVNLRQILGEAAEHPPPELQQE
jgi:5-methylcytosine-specific restriction endonuclease McrA